MKRSALIAAAALAVVSAAHAAPRPSSAIEVKDPWSRPAAAGTTGAGYMVLANHGRAADALVGAESPWARKVEIHRASMAGGVMSMEPQARVDVPAGGSVAFQPGGYHLMLIGLSKALRPGEAVPATLTFASGARMKVSFKVRSGVPAAPDMARHMGR